MHDTYSLLRHFADSWALLALFLFFLGAIVFSWRPGSRPIHEDAGRVPFRHEDRPKADAPPAPRQVPACGQNCGDRTCEPIPEARA